MTTAGFLCLACFYFLTACSFAPAVDSFRNEFGAEHRFETRVSLPKRDRRKEPVYLFIGILSTLEATGRREVVRKTWGRSARSPPLVDFRFFLEAPDRTASRQEAEQHSDLAYVPGASSYRTAVIKSYFVLEYAHTHFDCHFIMKADEDSFVNIQPLVQELQSICKEAGPDCRQAKLYIGQMNRAGTLKALDISDGQPTKFFNEPYSKRVGLEYYPNYMVGGGYIVTPDIASALIAVNSNVGLSVFHLEDANFGFWLSPWDVRYIDHPQFDVRTGPGVVEEHHHSDGSSYKSLRPDLASSNDFCSDRPWLVLHKALGEEMEFLMSLIDRCTEADS